MSKLFQLKEWLNISEAARHLSIVFREQVAEADVLRLALDRQLTLSVNFVNHRARGEKRLPRFKDAQFWEVSADLAASVPLVTTLLNAL